MTWVAADQIARAVSGNIQQDNYSNPPKKAIVTIGDVDVSASLSEVHSLESDITDHPVEGNDVTDHIVMRPREIQIEGIVSDVKLSTDSPTELLTDYQVSAEDGPAMEAWQTVEKYFVNHWVGEIRTGIRVYPNMGLKRFDVTRQKGDGTWTLRFSLQAKELRFTSTETVEAVPVLNPIDKSLKAKARSKGGKGNKKNGPNSTKTENASKSMLVKLGGVFG